MAHASVSAAVTYATARKAEAVAAKALVVAARQNELLRGPEIENLTYARAIALYDAEIARWDAFLAV